MLKLFETKSIQNSSLIKLPEFLYIKRNYLNLLQQVKHYYKTRTFNVNSKHLIARILYQLNVPIQYETDRYVEVINERTNYITRLFNLTNSVNTGVFHKGIFYGNESNTLILVDQEYFNPFEAEKDWENLEPIKVLLHPKSIISFHLPNDENAFNEHGNVVISINLAMLGLQYRSFLLKQLNTSGFISLGPEQFLMKYVFPGMLGSDMDITILNMFMNNYYNIPLGTVKKRLPLALRNYSSQLNRIIKQYILAIESRELKYLWILEILPSITKQNMQETLLLPDLFPTRQVLWALYFTRLKVMKFLIDIGGKESIRYNLTELNDLNLHLKRLLNDHVFEKSIKDKDTLIDILTLIDELMKIK